MIKAVVFDMDGVLIDAREWHYEALNKALKLFGYEITRYDHLSTYDGLPTRVKLQMLTVERGLPARAARLHQRAQAAVHDGIRRNPVQAGVPARVRAGAPEGGRLPPRTRVELDPLDGARR